MKCTFKILFYIKKNEVKKNGKCSVMIRITINGNNKQFCSSIEIEPASWDTKNGKTTGKTKETKLINETLESIKSSIHYHYMQLRMIHNTVTAIQVKNAYLGIEEKEQSLQEEKETLLYYFDFIIGLQKKRFEIGDITLETVEKYEYSKSYMIAFLADEYKLTNISIHKIDYEFIINYRIYLRKDDKMGHNQASKYMQKFKKVTRFAYDNGVLLKNPFGRFEITFTETIKLPLEENELISIIGKTFKTERLAQVRDVFVFCCFTGLSYCDAFKLDENSFTEYCGEKWINTPRKKTANPSLIPVLEIPKLILEKYRDKQKKGKLLPILTCQKMNDYLKEIADFCGINKNLTTHTARHTFATTITLEKGVPIETVQKMLGHKNIKTTAVYAKLTKNRIKQDMMEMLENKSLESLENSFKRSQ
ncbi:MAG: site-specific integrase [Bacteroidales bacterium]|jgi:site-specific recombinase XerD|nr:site-specific integrase [Bacteroidales bacterium]